MRRTKAVGGRSLCTDSIEAYQQLAQFNRRCADALSLVEGFGRRKMISRHECRYYGLLLQELRTLVSQSVIEQIDQGEISRAASFGRLRLRLEKQLAK